MITSDSGIGITTSSDVSTPKDFFQATPMMSPDQGSPPRSPQSETGFVFLILSSCIFEEMKVLRD